MMGLPANAKPTTWNGITYPSIAAAAKATGINESAMRKRLEKGYTCDGDILGASFPRPVEWNGISYPSVNQAAKANSISRGAMQWRIDKGYKCDSDVPVDTNSNSKSVEWDGVTYPSIAEAAKSLGINRTTMRMRIKRKQQGKSDMPGRGNRQGVSILWDGMEYPSIREAARCAGISYGIFYSYVQRGFTSSSEIECTKKPKVVRERTTETVRYVEKIKYIEVETPKRVVEPVIASVSDYFRNDRLQYERQRSEMSVPELAEIVGVSRTYIHGIESGKIIPPLKILLRLCKALYVSSDWLLGLDDELFDEDIP